VWVSNGARGRCSARTRQQFNMPRRDRSMPILSTHRRRGLERRNREGRGQVDACRPASRSGEVDAEVLRRRTVTAERRGDRLAVSPQERAHERSMPRPPTAPRQVKAVQLQRPRGDRPSGCLGVKSCRRAAVVRRPARSRPSGRHDGRGMVARRSPLGVASVASGVSPRGESSAQPPRGKAVQSPRCESLGCHAVMVTGPSCRQSTRPHDGSAPTPLHADLKGPRAGGRRGAALPRRRMMEPRPPRSREAALSELRAGGRRLPRGPGRMEQGPLRGSGEAEAPRCRAVGRWETASLLLLRRGASEGARVRARRHSPHGAGTAPPSSGAC
jgi:hypothetical protein